VPTPREDLAKMLKESRLQAGFSSHGALARRLSVSRPLISKAENPGQALPSKELIIAWAGVTGAPLDMLMDYARRAKSGTPEWFMPYLVAEANANFLRCWSPIVVPGIAQTTAYMRALFEGEGHPQDQIDELVQTRLERQQVIGHVHVTMIISQQVLNWLVGSASVMASQCLHLANVAERLALHVLPDGVNMGLWGAFDIAAQDSAMTVRLETVEDVTSTAPELVGKVMRAYERILGAALPRAESLALIRTAEEKWKTETRRGARPPRAETVAVTA
jgi:transcriptional regulator with XRE-family HTH domain